GNLFCRVTPRPKHSRVYEVAPLIIGNEADASPLFRQTSSQPGEGGGFARAQKPADHDVSGAALVGECACSRGHRKLLPPGNICPGWHIMQIRHKSISPSGIELKAVVEDPKLEAPPLRETKEAEVRRLNPYALASFSDFRLRASFGLRRFGPSGFDFSSD